MPVKHECECCGETEHSEPHKYGGQVHWICPICWLEVSATLRFEPPGR